MRAAYGRGSALILGPAAVGLGLAAHVVSGGAAPPFSVLVALTAVASLLATAAVRAGLPPWALGVGSGLLQQALHLLFTALAGPDGPLFPSAGHAHHGSPVSVPSLGAGGASLSVDPHLLVVTHLAAALLTALLAIAATRRTRVRGRMRNSGPQ